jgi:DNA-directed RNA polymerase specialized sigma24 family protein
LDHIGRRVVADPDSVRTYWNRETAERLRELSPEVRASLRETVDRARGHLDPEDAQLLEMLLLGYKIGEVAATLGVSYSAAALRVHRLRHRLARLLGTR